MDENSSEIVSKNNNSMSNILNYSNNLENIFTVFENASSILDKDLNEYINEHISTQNYYIFIYFLSKFKNENYLLKIRSILSNKIKSEKIDLNHLTENTLEGKYLLFIDLNCLSQAIDLNFDNFLKFYLNKEKKIPNPIIPKLLEKEHIEIIKIMLDLKVNVHEIESVNAFNVGKNSFVDLYFQPLNKVDGNMKIIKKSVLLPKHIVYYLYKSTTIVKVKREILIKKLAGIIDFDSEQILLFILKMKDQDLVEELILNDIVSIGTQNIVLSLIYALKYNCARIAYLIFQMIKKDFEHLNNLNLHRTLIRAIIDYPENIEIFIFIAKNLVPHISTSNLKYLLSTLEQLLYFKEIEECKLLRIVNVLKTSVLIIELIVDIRSAAHQLIIFCDNLKNQYMTLAKTLILETSDRNNLINLFKDKDLLNRETILIISNNRFVELLDNPATSELINKLWVGQVSTQGKFYLSSTQYDIIANCENSSQLLTAIKNINKKNPQAINFYLESFFIWKNSILVKFYSKTFLFVMIVLILQLSINILFIKLKNIFPNLTLINDYQPFIKDACYKIEGKNYTANQILSLSIERGNLTEFYSKYYLKSNSSNGTNSQMLSNFTLSLIPPLIQNISIVIDLYSTAKLELTDYVVVFSKSIVYLTYILIYPFFNIIFKKLYIYKSGIAIKTLNVQLVLDMLIFMIVMLRIFDGDPKFLDSFNRLDSIENFSENDYVRFSYYLAAMLILLWVKVVEDLKFSEKLGPLVRIVEHIIIEVFNFGVILSIEVFVIGCLANLLFALDYVNLEYRTLQNSILLMFSAIINQFSYSFDETNAVSGSIFLTFHLFISYVILLNMLIAVLSKIYEGLYENSKMLFQQQIISRKNDYLVDSHYGGIINLPFPLNILNIIFWPFYLCLKNQDKLEKFNNFVNYFAYSPLLLGMLIIHLLTQLVFSPITIFKIMKILVIEILNCGFNSFHIFNYRKLESNNNNKFRNILICLLLLIFYPLFILYTVAFDFLFYIRCLLKDPTNRVNITVSNDDICVSPLILSKIGEVFDTKPKNSDLFIENVIEEFVDQLSFYNQNFDFKNFLIVPSNIPRENLSLIREYSNFVKFANKLKLYNTFQKHVIIKSLVIKLIESNSNFVQIKKKFCSKNLIKKENNDDSLNLQNKSETNYLDIESEKYLNSIFNERERGSLKYNNMKKTLSKFTSLPKLFYKRISMINLQDVYNAMNIIKSSENLERSSLKLRSDLKKIRKNIGEIVEVINAREILLNQKKDSNVTLFKQRKASIFASMNSSISQNLADNLNKFNQTKQKLTHKLNKNLDKMHNIPEENDD